MRSENRNKVGDGYSSHRFKEFASIILKFAKSVTRVSVCYYKERGVIYVELGLPLLINPMLAPSMETSDTETSNAKSSK